LWGKGGEVRLADEQADYVCRKSAGHPFRSARSKREENKKKAPARMQAFSRCGSGLRRCERALRSVGDFAGSTDSGLARCENDLERGGGDGGRSGGDC